EPPHGFLACIRFRARNFTGSPVLQQGEAAPVVSVEGEDRGAELLVRHSGELELGSAAGAVGDVALRGQGAVHGEEVEAAVEVRLVAAGLAGGGGGDGGGQGAGLGVESGVAELRDDGGGLVGH